MVDFVAVAGLVTLVFLGSVQVTLALHVRNTLVDCASEGARFAGLADRGPDDGVARTRSLIGTALGPGYATDVTARYTTAENLQVVEVTVRAPVPAVGLWGPGELTVRGRGVVE